MEFNPVTALLGCEEYDEELIFRKLSEGFELAGIDASVFKGKKVAIKPNLLLGYAPEKAATTHPAVLAGVIRLLREMGAGEIILAESPGGPFNENSLRSIYRATGLEKLSQDTGVPLNFDTSASEIPYDAGITSKMFSIVNALWNADVIVNVCKLKTHNLSGISCATKNLFGTIPGITKFEMHARFKEPETFFSMLVDLCELIHSRHEVVHVCDAVIGMEGNGPSGGHPRNIGALLVGKNPYCLDTAAAELIGMTGKAPITSEAVRRGLCPDSLEKIQLAGEPVGNLIVPDYIEPDNNLGKKFALIPKFLQPRPVIDRKKCAGCGVCQRSCPGKTISMVKGKAKIDPKGCIRCYCCQELCKFKAVKIKKPFVFKIIK